MGNLVTDAFDVFDSHIDLGEAQLSLAIEQADQLSAEITKDQSIEGCVLTGSIARGTAVRRFSDVDILAVLSNPSCQQLGDSKLAISLALRAVERSVSTAYIAGNTICVGLPNNLKIDVTPALVKGKNSWGDVVYQIPGDKEDQWQDYAPVEQARRVNEVEMKAGISFKRAVRALKWWNGITPGPLTSFQIEDFVCDIFSQGHLAQQLAILRVLEQAICFQQRGMLVSHVSVGSIAFQSLFQARDMAQRAIRFENSREYFEAIAVWRGLLGDQFPNLAE